MRRACKVTLKFATLRKRRAINALLSRYRAAVNFYIRRLWTKGGGLNAETLNSFQSVQLSARYRSQALKQALDIVSSTRKAEKTTGSEAGLPIFYGAAVLDAKFVSVEEGRGSFDLVIRLSSLVSGRRIVIPTKRTRVLNKWLGKPDACLLQGCALTETSLVLWISLPESEYKKEGEVLGVDIGVNKLLSLSTGSHLGTDFPKLSAKLRRKLPGSRARQRCYQERKCFIGQQINKLPWDSVAAIGLEKLSDMKRGKRKGRSRAFRKAIAPWTYRQVINGILQKAQEHRVLPVAVDPAYTSRTCPVCGRCDKLNRRGENFLCTGCGHSADADTVGAQNILDRTLQTLGSVESPSL